MLSHEETSHENFQLLCALAAVGELSEEELTEVKAHMSMCFSCRIEYADYVDILQDKILLGRPQPKTLLRFHFPMRARGYRKRFIAEAERRGFHFSEAAVRPQPFWRRPIALAAMRPAHGMALILLLLVGVIAVLSYKLLRLSDGSSRALLSEIAKTEKENDSVGRAVADHAEHQLADGAKPAATTQEASSTRHSDEANIRWLEAELSKAREENFALLTRIKALEEQLQGASLQVQGFRAEAEASKSTGGELAAKLKEAERNLGEMSGEIKDLRGGRSKDASTIAAQEARMKELSESLREQAEALDHQRRLLAADRDIRDLMTARNLHIIDVFDVDGKGKTRRTFGRAFYTEDKSLIFYAFDLEDRHITKANYSLQAWGYQQSTERSVQSLGIFYIDDQKQNRWALKFEDAEVLAQIDAVFVTIEPPGGSKRPTGDKLLYAYLRNKPNHP